MKTYKLLFVFVLCLLFIVPLPIMAEDFPLPPENSKVGFELWIHRRQETETEYPVIFWWYDWKEDTIGNVYTPDEFIAMAGLEQAEILFKGDEVPVVCARVTDEEIERLDGLAAEFTMEYYSGGTPYMLMQFTSTDARLILQYSVGKNNELISWGPDIDVDNDGDINSTDARLALQAAIGKIVIAWPLDTVFNE